MDRKRLKKFMLEIKEECLNHNKCDECPLLIRYKHHDVVEDVECILDIHTGLCEDPGYVDYEKLIDESEED